MQVENIEEKVTSPPPSKLSSPTTEALETAILKVFLNSGSCVIVKFAVDTLVKVIEIKYSKLKYSVYYV